MIQDFRYSPNSSTCRLVHLSTFPLVDLSTVIFVVRRCNKIVRNNRASAVKGDAMLFVIPTSHAYTKIRLLDGVARIIIVIFDLH